MHTMYVYIQQIVKRKWDIALIVPLLSQQIPKVGILKSSKTCIIETQYS